MTKNQRAAARRHSRAKHKATHSLNQIAVKQTATLERMMLQTSRSGSLAVLQAKQF
ncbi:MULTISPECIES: hypothetical protein [Mesorhizobium]|uniref:Uncharacterized protein n=2 Tax=Mesorhizobium TaxID=68287 RepID=G6YFW3_9HYPH|nr:MULTISPECIES: hypothetical protein [Mesorhizobium]EHH09357.1 hypothetical protein MEA186_24337 [Mesorhizobium amorphae CCNWGS0123]MCV3211815.1 hypothetical protein [Mesorhizobium sp. YC-2]MCV3233541.1 hypothetical protein [Mesorhizobium sp. YC-39]MCV3241958.1 hypothetical protein [Mesorhizobium sp. ZC-5]